jgi:hypothetical protein
MTKKTTIILASILTIFTPVFTACDSSTPLNSGAPGLNLNNRYNSQFLTDNSGDIAQMPSNLTSGDILTLTPTSEDFTINNVNFPRSEGESAGVIRPIDSGSVSIEGLRYLYARVSGDGRESSLNLAANDRTLGPVFDRGMSELASTGAGVGGALSTVLTTSKYPIDSADIFNLTGSEKEAIREAVRSLGYVAVDMPNANAIGRGSLNGSVQVDVDNIVVLFDRKMNFVVTSTNAEILATGEVTGTFDVEDSYYDLALAADPGDAFYRVIIARIPTFSDNLQVQTIKPLAEGTFVLKLSSLDDINPNF